MRNLLFLVRRSLAQHKLSTAITVTAVALACGLVMSVFTISAQTRDAFTGGDAGFDAVLGARGSQLQLVLNTVFHLETSQGNIPWEMYKTVRKHPHVELAIPYALGDNYRGFRIVGTTLELFKKTGRFKIAQGVRVLRPAPAAKRSSAATSRSRPGLKVGDMINPYHGLIYDERTKHEERYVIKAVLQADQLAVRPRDLDPDRRHLPHGWPRPARRRRASSPPNPVRRSRTNTRRSRRSC